MVAPVSLVGDALRPALLADGVLRESSVPELYQRSAVFESVARGIELVAHAAGPEVGDFEPLVHLAPIMPREAFLRTDYLRSFPHLIGSVQTFQGDDQEHRALLRTAEEGGDWSRALSPAEVTLCSAACHSIYPQLAGALPEGGR